MEEERIWVITTAEGNVINVPRQAISDGLVAVKRHVEEKEAIMIAEQVAKAKVAPAAKGGKE